MVASTLPGRQRGGCALHLAKHYVFPFSPVRSETSSKDRDFSYATKYRVLIYEKHAGHNHSFPTHTTSSRLPAC